MTAVIEKKWLYAIILIFVTYLAAHLSMLFVEGFWWDDSLIWNYPEEKLSYYLGPQSFNSPSMELVVRMFDHDGANWLQATRLYRIIPFFCGLLSVACVFIIIKKISNNFLLTVYTSLFAAALCVDKTVLLIICCNYQISLTLFLIGLVLFVYDYYQSNKLLVLLSGLCWCIALITWRSAVIIVPYVVLIACIIKTKFNWKKWESYKELVIYALKHYWLVIAFVFLFIILFKTILAQGGEYVDYYSFNPITVILSPISAVSNGLLIVFHYIGDVLHSFNSSSILGLLSLFMIAAIYPIVKWIKGPIANIDNKQVWIVVGFFFCAILPHVMIHSFNPSINVDGWMSRMTSMLLLPFSFILAIIALKLPSNIRIAFVSIILAGSIWLSNQTNLDYFKGWCRNEALIECFKKNPYLDGKKVKILFSGNDYSVFKSESDRYYEYEACARVAYGINTETQCSPINSKLEKDASFSPNYFMIVDPKRTSMSNIKILYMRLFMPDAYSKYIQSLLSVKIIPCDER